MKIGFDGKRALHNLRGLGNYSRTLIKSLDEHYSENEYLLFSPKSRNENLIEWSKALSSNCEIITPQSILGRSFPTLWRSLLLKGELEQHHLDVYHGLSHELPPGINNLNTLKVVTIHDLLYLKFPQFFSLIDRQTYHRKFSYSCKVSDIVIAICEQTKADIIKYLKVPEEKIHVIYQSCSPDFYHDKTNDELDVVRKKYSLTRPFIFHIATMEENKNTMGIVKAYKSICESIDEDLILVGRGKKYKEKVLSYIEESGLGNRVRVLDDVADQDVPSLFQLAKLFVFPSFYEGFGIPIIEALFSKTPVITSVGGCFPESGGPSTRYVDPYSSTDIGNAMVEILKDEVLQKEMAQKGHEFVQKFHWKNTSNDLINLYLTHL